MKKITIIINTILFIGSLIGFIYLLITDSTPNEFTPSPNHIATLLCFIVFIYSISTLILGLPTKHPRPPQYKP